jgi:hypothetical protein
MMPVGGHPSWTARMAGCPCHSTPRSRMADRNTSRRQARSVGANDHDAVVGKSPKLFMHGQVGQITSENEAHAET